MLKRDFLQKQLEQLGIVIAKLIEKMTQLQSGADVQGIQKISDEVLQSEFDLNLETILALQEEAFISMLSENKKFSTGHLSLLAEVLFKLGESYERAGNPLFANNINKKTLLLLEYVTETDKTFSADRQEKINDLKSKL